MLRVIKNIVTNIAIKEKPVPLGRWGHNCDVSTQIKSALANHDCCGDDLCGDPNQAKKLIDNEKVKSSASDNYKKINM